MNSEIRYLAQVLLHLGTSPLDFRDKRVIHVVARKVYIGRESANHLFEQKPRFGEWLSDKVAQWGGSWLFLVAFSAFVAIWYLVGALTSLHPDEHTLDVIISILTLFIDIIIMMSQNRQSKQDRLTAALSYEVGVKSDVEIAHLHKKVDLIMEMLKEGRFDGHSEQNSELRRGDLSR